MSAKKDGQEYRATDSNAGDALLKVVRALVEAGNPLPAVRAYLNSRELLALKVELRGHDAMTPDEAEGLADSLREAASESRALAVRALPNMRKAVEKAHHNLRAIANGAGAGTFESSRQIARNSAEELETMCRGFGYPLPAASK